MTESPWGKVLVEVRVISWYTGLRCPYSTYQQRLRGMVDSCTCVQIEVMSFSAGLFYGLCRILTNAVRISRAVKQSITIA